MQAKVIIKNILLKLIKLGMSVKVQINIWVLIKFFLDFPAPNLDQYLFLKLQIV